MLRSQTRALAESKGPKGDLGSTMAEAVLGFHGKTQRRRRNTPGLVGADEEAHPEASRGVREVGEVAMAANSTTATCGSGDSSLKLASSAEELGLDWLRGTTKTSAAVLLDTAARLGDDGGYVDSTA